MALMFWLLSLQKHANQSSPVSTFPLVRKNRFRGSLEPPLPAGSGASFPSIRSLALCRSKAAEVVTALCGPLVKIIHICNQACIRGSMAA